LSNRAKMFIHIQTEPVPVETSRDFEEKRGNTRGLIMGVELWTKGYSL
jgi:hypothetical protein